MTSDRDGVPFRSWRGLIALALLVAGPSVRSAEEPVSVELVVPATATRVIGDDIPLLWKFKSRDTEPLGFMWEGCCRLNGRLDAMTGGRPIETIPPGQAVAHMFARAEVLQPGRIREFETRLSDWARLTSSGTYTLTGHYVGVRQEQRPQVPRGTKLWRGSASTPSIDVSVLSVKDYLGERQRRVVTRAVSLELRSDAPRLPAIRPAPLDVRLRNSGRQPVRFTWPNDFQLWIVDRLGRRLGPGGTLVEGPHEEFELAPGAEQVRSVPFHSGLIEGEPFGDYDVFVDLADGGDGRPRVPSNAVAIRWELTGEDLVGLLKEAAAGPKAGLRNAPLKLLRTYLGELGTPLGSIDPATLQPPESALLDQLRLAACLKPVAPKPGRVTLRLRVEPDGSATMADRTIDRCLAGTGGSPTNRLEALLRVRRHLGWELGIGLEPTPETSLATVLAVSAQFAPFDSELAGAPQALFAGSETNVVGQITFRREPIPASRVLRLKGTGPELTAELRGSTSQDVAQINPLADPQILGESLFGVGSTLVVAQAGVKWSDVLRILEPGLRKGAQVDLCGER